jgi:plastocyanin domain-containing protein
MVSGGGSSTEGAGDVDLTGYATEEYVDAEVSQLQKQIDTKVDTTADSVNEMAGEYNITGVMYVETPELPEVSVNEPN